MPMNWKPRFVLAGLGLAAVTMMFAGCSPVTDYWKDVEGDGPHVLVSFPPLYCFTKQVGGEHVKVMSLLTTLGPHDYMPTQQDSLKAAHAELFLVNGLTLDNFVGKVKNNSGNNRLQLVAVAEAIPDKDLIHLGEHGHEHGHEGHHHHGEYDPHVWLGVPEVIIMVNKIRDELVKINPRNEAEYKANAENYVAELKEKVLDYGKKKLAGAKNRKIIATHDSLRYFARAFDLEVVDFIQPDPGISPNAAKLKELTDLIKKEKIRVITVEPQYSKATAKNLLRQLQSEGVDVALVDFDTLETAEANLTKDYYVEVMRQNIDRLAEALQ